MGLMMHMKVHVRTIEFVSWRASPAPFKAHAFFLYLLFPPRIRFLRRLFFVLPAASQQLQRGAIRSPVPSGPSSGISSAYSVSSESFSNMRPVGDADRLPILGSRRWRRKRRRHGNGLPVRGFLWRIFSWYSVAAAESWRRRRGDGRWGRLIRCCGRWRLTTATPLPHPKLLSWLVTPDG